MAKSYYVWVLEIAILKANTAALYREDKGLRCGILARDIAYWEIWECFNCRSEAVASRNNRTGLFSDRKVPKEGWRIRKYVPAVSL